MNISKLLTAAIGAAECVAMHNRVKDVASDNDDNDECADGKLARTTDRNCLDGIDIRKYSNFRTLFHSLKKRNDPPVNINRIMYLSPVKDRSRHGIAFGLESCLTSQSFQQANVTSQSSNDKYVLRSCEMSKKSQPITFSDVNFTKIPINCSTEKLKLFINKQTLSTELTPFSKTTDKMKTTRGTFDLLLSSNKVKMRTDEEKSRKIADVTTPLESPNLPNGTNKTTKTIVALSEVQVPCSSLFSRSFEYLTRKKKEETERTKEDTVTRRLSFDATWSTAKKKYLERSSELDIALTNREEMDGRTLVHLNRKSTDCDWRRPSEKDNNDSNKSSSKRDKKEASFDETSSLEFESCANANKSQEINTLRDINKTLATKLARAERIAQLLQIQLKFYEKTNDVKFACKFADVINQLKLLLPSDQFRDEALEILNSASPSVNFNDEKAIILDTLLKEIECDERELLNPETLRKNCERLLEYARKHPPVFMELQNQINEVRICLLE
uniref:Uncharacterized protein n=1 Tax=Setaria digitata TaxID=48799 RepID=A0A915PVI9_9BILA